MTKAIDIKDNVYSTYEGLNLETGAKAEIAAIPCETMAQAAGDYEIVITTNYGVVTVDKAIDVTNKDGKIQIAAGPTEKSETNAGDNLSFAYELATMMNRTIEGEAQPRIARTVNVDMTKADITGLEIKNSDQLIAAYRAYDLMGKKTTDNIKFTLIPTDGKFELTKDAIEAINRHKLSSEAGAELITTGITEFTLSGYGKDAYTTVPEIDQIDGDVLVLAADSKWTLDVNSAAAVNMYTQIKNMGELQISEGTGTTPLTVQIINNNAITFEGTEITVPTLTSNGGTVAIAEGQTVKLKNGTFNDKTVVTVNGELISNSNIAINSGAAVDVYGKLLNTKGNTLANAGTINIMDAAAQVILSTNENGIVNVTVKDNNLNTGSKKGYVKLAVDADEFALNAENMGVANYVEFSGSALAIETATYGYYVEMQANAKVTSENKVVSAFIVNDGVEVIIADGSVVTCADIINYGKIYNYGKFKFPTTVTNKGTIYDL